MYSQFITHGQKNIKLIRSLLLFPYGPISASRINLKSNCSYYAIVFFCAYLVECRPCVPLLWHLRCL